MQELTQHQRMVSFIAQQSRNMFPILETFAVKLARVCPAAAGMLRLGSATERHALAWVAAEACKQVDRLDGESWAARRVRERLARAGVGAGQMRAVRSAFVDALREHAGTTWTSEIERDWNEVVGRCLGTGAVEETRTRAAA